MYVCCYKQGRNKESNKTKKTKQTNKTKNKIIKKLEEKNTPLLR